MTAQPNLFPLPPALGAMSDREQDALDHLTANPAGVRSIDLGRHLHQLNGCRFCSPDTFCKYAHSEGERIGGKLRGRKLAKKPGGKWVLLHPPRPVADPDVDPFPEGF